MNLLELLKEINVLCQDNGKFFTNTSRLEVIEEKLSGKGYVCTNGNLFRLYSKKSVADINGKLLLISSHVDCEMNINRCFSQEQTENILQGTYDNSITNAAVLSLMMEGKLPEQVIVAFTGDEEINSGGAIEVTKYLRSLRKTFECIILDVTDFGWYENADFTVENNFWDDALGKCACTIAESTGYSWKFVPEDLTEIPKYIPNTRIYFNEAEPDESWDYDELNVKCFSLCLPVHGNMHSNVGVITKKLNLLHYTAALQAICNAWADNNRDKAELKRLGQLE